MANTYKLIQTVTVGAAGATNIEFSAIPQTYTDLVVLYSIRTNRAAQEVDNIKISFNGSITTYTARNLYGNGASAASSTYSTQRGGLAPSAASTASIFSNTEIYVPNYTGSTNKSFSVNAITENNATTSYCEMVAGLWSTTSAITSVGFAPQDGTLLLQYSSASLYGIKNT